MELEYLLMFHRQQTEGGLRLFISKMVIASKALTQLHTYRKAVNYVANALIIACGMERMGNVATHVNASVFKQPPANSRINQIWRAQRDFSIDSPSNLVSLLKFSARIAKLVMLAIRQKRSRAAQSPTE